jgi:hypothetical protein
MYVITPGSCNLLTHPQQGLVRRPLYWHTLRSLPCAAVPLVAAASPNLSKAAGSTRPAAAQSCEVHRRRLVVSTSYLSRTPPPSLLGGELNSPPPPSSVTGTGWVAHVPSCFGGTPSTGKQPVGQCRQGPPGTPPAGRGPPAAAAAPAAGLHWRLACHEHGPGHWQPVAASAVSQAQRLRHLLMVYPTHGAAAGARRCCARMLVAWQR